MAYNLTEMSEWYWPDFIQVRENEDKTEYEDSLIELVLSIVDEKVTVAAIKRAIERVDGKQAENINIEYPKFYVRYPNAKNVVSLVGKEVIDMPEVSLPGPEMATAGIRGAIAEMSGRPKGAAAKVLEIARRFIDDPMYVTRSQIKVKEVIASALIVLSKTKQGAMEELLNQIDGKVATTYKLLGDDVYFNRYDEEVPVGGIVGKDGVYMIETKNVTNSWALKLGKGDAS